MRIRQVITRAASIGVAIALIATGHVNALDVGQPAPNFTLVAPGGRLVRLADLLPTGSIVLYTFLQAYTKDCAEEINSFEQALKQFQAAGAQLVGVSADHVTNLDAFARSNKITHLLLSDFRLQMLPAYNALITDPRSPSYRQAKRAYFIIDRQGVIRYVKVEDNPLDLLNPQEILQVLSQLGL